MVVDDLDPEAVRRARHASGPSDRLAAEGAFAALYSLVSLREPVVEWLPSPLAGALRCRELLKANVAPIPYAVEYWQMTATADSGLVTTGNDDPFAITRPHTYALDGPLGGDPAPREAAYSQVQSSLAAAGFPDAAAGMRPGQFDDSPERHLRHALGGATSDLPLDEASILRHRAILAIAAGPWWAFDGHVIVSERAPQMRLTDDGALESSDDFALRYADGWSIWAHPHEPEPHSDAVPRPQHATPSADFVTRGPLGEDGAERISPVAASDGGDTHPALAQYRDEWLRIAATTIPCDRAGVAEVLTRLYRERGLDAPQILWVSSPRAGLVAWHLARGTRLPILNPYRRGEVGTGERRQVLALADPFGFSDRWLRSIIADAERTLVVGDRQADRGSRDLPGFEHRIGRVAESIGMTRPLGALRNAVERALASTHPQSGPAPREDLDAGDALRAATLLLGDRYEDLVGMVGPKLAMEGVRASLTGAFASTLDTSRSAPHAIGAMNSPAWDPLLALLGIYATPEMPPGSTLSIGPERRRQIGDRLALARSGCAWWAMEGLAIVAEPPTTLQLDEAHLLHGERGPAIAYADDLAVWAWHGVAVPRFVIEAPEQISVPKILDEPNQEVRRVMVDRMGYERLITESGARLISEDGPGKLWQIPVAIGGHPGSRPEQLHIVEVVNSTPEPDGTYRHYFLRVPPHLRGAHEAVAWTFGLGGREYAPGIQT